MWTYPVRDTQGFVTLMLYTIIILYCYVLRKRLPMYLSESIWINTAIIILKQLLFYIVVINDQCILLTKVISWRGRDVTTCLKWCQLLQPNTLKPCRDKSCPAHLPVNISMVINPIAVLLLNLSTLATRNEYILGYEIRKRNMIDETFIPARPLLAYFWENYPI